jgi:hypothetical protein
MARLRPYMHRAGSKAAERRPARVCLKLNRPPLNTGGQFCASICRHEGTRRRLHHVAHLEGRSRLPQRPASIPVSERAVSLLGYSASVVTPRSRDAISRIAVCADVAAWTSPFNSRGEINYADTPAPALGYCTRSDRAGDWCAPRRLGVWRGIDRTGPKWRPAGSVSNRHSTLAAARPTQINPETTTEDGRS